MWREEALTCIDLLIGNNVGEAGENNLQEAWGKL